MEGVSSANMFKGDLGRVLWVDVRAAPIWVGTPQVVASFAPDAAAHKWPRPLRVAVGAVRTRMVVQVAHSMRYLPKGQVGTKTQVCHACQACTLSHVHRGDIEVTAA